MYPCVSRRGGRGVGVAGAVRHRAGVRQCPRPGGCVRGVVLRAGFRLGAGVARASCVEVYVLWRAGGWPQGRAGRVAGCAEGHGRGCGEGGGDAAGAGGTRLGQPHVRRGGGFRGFGARDAVGPARFVACRFRLPPTARVGGAVAPRVGLDATGIFPRPGKTGRPFFAPAQPGRCPSRRPALCRPRFPAAAGAATDGWRRTARPAARTAAHARPPPRARLPSASLGGGARPPDRACCAAKTGTGTPASVPAPSPHPSPCHTPAFRPGHPLTRPPAPSGPGTPPPHPGALRPGIPYRPVPLTRTRPGGRPPASWRRPCRRG